MFLKYYERFYAYLYQWSIKVNGTNENHNENATIMLVFLVYLNSFGIFAVLTEGMTFEILKNEFTGKALSLVIGLLLYFVNYKYFTYNNRYKRLEKELKKTPGWEKKVKYYGLGPISFSFVFWVGLAFYAVD